MSIHIIKADKIITGKDLTLMTRGAIQIEDGKITRIYNHASQIPSGEHITVTDLGDKTLIPGMIDCHNHLALDTRIEHHLVKMNDCECEQTIRALKTMNDDLHAGVTTARCLGDRFYIDVTCKKHRKKDGYPVQNLLSAALACAPLTVMDM